MDPRVKTPVVELARQFDLSMRVYRGIRQDSVALAQARSLRSRLGERKAEARGDAAAAVGALDARVEGLIGSGGGFGGAGRGAGESLARLRGNLASLLDMLQEADGAPTTQLGATVDERLGALDQVLADWRAVLDRDLVALNRRLRAARLSEIRIE
jgi:hypothetical protein